MAEKDKVRIGKGEAVGITQRARGGWRRRASAATATQTRDVAPDAVYGPELPNESIVHLVMDLGLRIGEIQMASGAGAADVTATILAVTNSYGLPHCEVDVIYTSITASCYLGTETTPITLLRVVRDRSIDYTRLVEVEKLVRRITEGEVPASVAYTELDQIATAPHPFPRWVATLAWAGMAAALSVMLGGNPTLAVVAAGATALVDRVGRVLNKRAIPFFFQQLVGGAIATSIALVFIATKWVPTGELAIAASIIVLLSGMTVVSSMQDAIGGYNVTAAGRLTELALMSAGLIAGVALALYVAQRLLGGESLGGVNVGALQQFGTAQFTSRALKVPVETLAGATTAVCFALACYAPSRPLIASGVGGAIAALLYALLTLADLSPVLASAIATAVVGFLGGITARRLRIPPLVIAVSGVVPLLPGLAVYRGLYELSVRADPAGMSTLMLAVAVALALGAGVVLGEFLAQPVRTGLGRLERRVAGPRLAGPLRPTHRRLD
jgi:uncharacterized membrane protein YjjP (DUF1212 family)